MDEKPYDMEQALMEANNALRVVAAALADFANGRCEGELTMADAEFINGAAVLVSQIARRCEEAVPDE